MAHDVRELIELWDDADRACERAQAAVDATRFRVEMSAALIGEQRAHLVQTLDLIVRSKALLSAYRRPRIR